jgi:hypothetical protein
VLEPGDSDGEATTVVMVTAGAVNTNITEMNEEKGSEITTTNHQIAGLTTFRFPYRITDNPRNCLLGLENLDHLSTRLTVEERQYLLDVGVEHIAAPTSRGMWCLYSIERGTAICSPKIINVQSSYLCRL